MQETFSRKGSGRKPKSKPRLVRPRQRGLIGETLDTSRDGSSRIHFYSSYLDADNLSSVNLFRSDKVAYGMSSRVL